MDVVSAPSASSAPVPAGAPVAQAPRATVDFDAPPLLRVEDLRVVYRTSGGDLPAVDQVTFALQPGQRLGLIGESGSGKTTMATALMRLTRPPGRIVGGRVMLDDTDLLSLDDRALRRIRHKQIALVPQGAMNSLNPVMRIEDQMIDAIEAHEPHTSRRALDARVAAQLARVGLATTVARRFPHELSGGMKQRAVMAISTVLDPKVIVADEPTSALDVVVQRQVMQTLGRLQEGIGSAVVLIGHDMGLIAQFADLIGVMYAGRLVEIGPVDDILLSPRHPYTRLLIESLPRLTAKGKLVGIPGLPPALLSLPPGCAFNPRCPYVFDRCTREVPPVIEVGPLRRAACHLYPDHKVLPPLPSSVILDPDAPMAEVSLQMEGREDPGRADAEAALADELIAGGARASTGDSARGITDLAQSDIDEMHRGGRS
jgi:peptide/nickel transport system ATP-binding protein